MTHSRIWLGASLACGTLTLWSCSSMSLGGGGSGGGDVSTGGSPGAGGASGAGGSPGAGGDSGAGGSPGAGGGSGAGGRPGAGGGAGVGAGGTAGAGPAGSGGNPGTGGCDSIEFRGPVLKVFDAQTGTPICDPTFAILVQRDAGSSFVDASASACTPGSFYCPMTYDGGVTPCPFYLEDNLGYSTDATVDVRAPGYEHAEVSGVSVGRAGCVPPFFPASDLNVNLSRLPPDAGAAADAQLSSTDAARE
jgi:hypothetical protein